MSALRLPEPGAWATARERSATVCVAVGLAAFVAAAHLEAAVQSLARSGALAGALVAVALLVMGWSRRLWHDPGPAVLGSGSALFGGLAVVWLVSRTSGPPLGAGGAPVGPLDALTALDEMLLAWLPFVLGRGGGRTADLAPVVGFVMVSLSFVLLSMGCEVGTATAAHGVAGAGPPLYCHLF